MTAETFRSRSVRFLIACACAVVAGVCLTACAAGVSPSTASGYLFSKPLYPEKITGVVMGSPPAYYTARSEDADWISEAIAERQALENGRMPDANTVLYPEFGIWPLSETNRFHRWSTAVDVSGKTNVVVGFHLVTNSPPMGILSDDVGHSYQTLVSRIAGLTRFGQFLDGAASISPDPRVAYDWNESSHPAYTNVTYMFVSTNSTTNAFSVIEMPMTNGTTSVYTNSWTFTAVKYDLVPVTNAAELTYIDYCHQGDGPFPVYTNYPYMTLLSYPPARTEVIAAMYETLKGFVRLWDNASITNSAQTLILWDSTDGYRTNSTQTVGSSYWLHSSNAKSYSWNPQSQAYEEHEFPNASGYMTPTYVTIAPTRFSSQVVTTGEAARVEIEASFAVVDFEYSFQRQTGDIPNLSWESVEQCHKDVLVPIESTELDLNGMTALALSSLDAYDLCVTAANSSNVTPPPPFSQSSAARGESRRWNATCSRFILIYRLKPTTNL